MIGLHEDLAAREAGGRPVKIGLIGAGQMGTDVVAQCRMMQGIDVVAAADIDLERARNAYKIGLVEGEVVEARTAAEADAAVRAGKLVVARDYHVITDMATIDVMLEATGAPEIGSRAALRSARRGQQLAMMNVETDITVGPILHRYARHKGVLYALAAGDEPAACKELYDFALALGLTIVAAGKGKNNPLDRHAMPTDPAWAAEAARRGLTPTMLIEFVDGSKTMVEMAAVSNATGLAPDVRGMHGPATSRDELSRTFALKQDGGVLNKIGVVDFGIGRVAPGVFLIVSTPHPRLREALVLRDMGNGPYYTLFRPFHLCSIEVPLTCALLVLRKQSNMAPLDHLTSEVFAVAKRDLAPGQTLDGIGGTSFYCLIDTFEAARAEGLLPAGLAKGATLTHPVAADTPITYADVTLKRSTLLDLRRLQDAWMAGALAGNPWALLFSHICVATPLVIIIVSATLQDFDRSLEQAAQILGATPFQTFFRVTFPIIRPGIISGALFAFIVSFDEVVIAAFIGGYRAATLPKRMFDNVRDQMEPTVAAVSTLLVGLSILMLIAISYVSGRGRRREEREKRERGR